MAFECSEPRSLPGLDFMVRCGKCRGCTDLRAWLKRSRIGLEVAGHEGERAWFCTLTFREAFEDEADAYREVQKWLKQVRIGLARSGTLKEGLRFVGVAEHGSRGTKRLHYHVLLFSPVVIRKRELAEWTMGFFKYEVADESAWQYVLKYLSKGGRKAKVRASIHLGRGTMRQVAGHELVEAVLQAFPGATVVKVGGFAVPRDLQASSPQEPYSERLKRELGPDAWMVWSKSDRLRRDTSPEPMRPEGPESDP